MRTCTSPQPILAHLDLDAFFAAVEELEHPELIGRPLIVGGDPRGRGVVATANYEARRYGIGSAMSSADWPLLPSSSRPAVIETSP